MRLVVDSSTLISLARAGLLDLLRRLPLESVVIDTVRAETVAGGLAAGYADAAAIEAALAGLPVQETSPTPGSADAAVLIAAQGAGGLVANDLALGRRARNLGLAWLRTADLVVLVVRSSVLSRREGLQALDALEAAGHLTPGLAAAYREEVG